MTTARVPAFRDSAARLAAPLAAYRLLLLGLVYVSTRALPPMFNERGFLNNFRWPSGSAVSLGSYFSTWDAQHYLFMSRYGYQPETNSIFFFPR